MTFLFLFPNVFYTFRCRCFGDFIAVALLPVSEKETSAKRHPSLIDTAGHRLSELLREEEKAVHIPEVAEASGKLLFPGAEHDDAASVFP